MGEFVRALAVADLAPGASLEVDVRGRAVVVHNVGGRFYATGARCPHQGGPLGRGLLDGTKVICPVHAWAWDVVTGEGESLPSARLETFAVEVEDGQVMVEV